MATKEKKPANPMSEIKIQKLTETARKLRPEAHFENKNPRLFSTTSTRSRFFHLQRSPSPTFTIVISDVLHRDTSTVEELLLKSSCCCRWISFLLIFINCSRQMHASLHEFSQWWSHSSVLAMTLPFVDLSGRNHRNFPPLLLMPLLVPIFGEEKLLSIGLSVAVVNILLNSIAWSDWGVYLLWLLYLFGLAYT